MKSALRILYLLLISATAAYSQSFSIGFVGGPSSVSALRTSINENKVSPALGYSASLGLQFKLNRFFYLRVEPGLERKGFNIATQVPDSFNVPKDEKGVLDYFSAPVMLRFQAGKKWKLMIDLGAYASYLNKAESTYESPSGTKSTVDASQNFRKIDLGGAVGAGIGYTFAKRLTVSAHFKRSYGLIDVSKSVTYNYNSLKTLADNYTIGIAYGFK